jgi:hypothetical protein
MKMNNYYAQLHPKTFEKACDDDITLGEAIGPDGCNDFNMAADILIQYKEAIEDGDEDMAEYMCLRLGRLLLPAGVEYINRIVEADE